MKKVITQHVCSNQLQRFCIEYRSNFFTKAGAGSQSTSDEVCVWEGGGGVITNENLKKTIDFPSLSNLGSPSLIT